MFSIIKTKIENKNMIKKKPIFFRSYVDIESNHFLCDCDRLGWLIAAVRIGFDSETIEEASGIGTIHFMQRIFESAGFCLECGARSCEPGEQRVEDFADTALEEADSGLYSCSSSGKVLKPQKTAHSTTEAPTRRPPTSTTSTSATRRTTTETPRSPNNLSKHSTEKPGPIFSDKSSNRNRNDPDGEEEDLAALKNLELSGSGKLPRLNFILLTCLSFFVAASASFSLFR